MHKEPAPTFGISAASRQGRTSQNRRLLADSWQLAPSQQKHTHTQLRAYIGDTLRAFNSGEQKGSVIWGPIEEFIHKVSSPRLGDVTDLPNTYK